MNAVPVEFQTFLTLAICGAIVSLAPIAFKFLLDKSKEAAASGKATLGAAMWDTLIKVAHAAVLYTEQAKLNEWIDATSEAAKDHAVAYAETAMAAAGFPNVNIEAISGVIESQYNLFKNGFGAFLQAEGVIDATVEQPAASDGTAG